MTRRNVTRAKLDAPALRDALVRLLWNSVADEASCCCDPGDPGPECHAWRALFGGRKHWPGPEKAADALLMMRKEMRP